MLTKLMRFFGRYENIETAFVRLTIHDLRFLCKCINVYTVMRIENSKFGDWTDLESSNKVATN